MKWFRKFLLRRRAKKMEYYSLMMDRAYLLGFEYEYHSYARKLIALKEKNERPN